MNPSPCRRSPAFRAAGKQRRFRREDYGAEVDTFFDRLDEPAATLARDLRGIILKALPKVSESIKWGMPVYGKDELICAIRPTGIHVALQFYAAGTSLPDPEDLLEGTGKKMRHVKIYKRSDLRKKLFTSWLRRAAGMS